MGALLWVAIPGYAFPVQALDRCTCQMEFGAHEAHHGEILQRKPPAAARFIFLLHHPKSIIGHPLLDCASASHAIIMTS